jgi:hypothetical protein
MLHNSLSRTAAQNKTTAEAMFQQDRATFYTGRIFMQFLHNSLGKRKPLGLLWQPRSPYLNLQDYFHGIFEDSVLKQRPHCADELNMNINVNIMTCRGGEASDHCTGLLQAIGHRGTYLNHAIKQSTHLPHPYIT